MNTELLLDPIFSTRLTLTLLHSLWQMTLLAVIAWVLGRLWKRRSVERSYAAHVCALIGGLAVLPVTYALVDVAEPQQVMQAGRADGEDASPASPAAAALANTPVTVVRFEPPPDAALISAVSAPALPPSAVSRASTPTTVDDPLPVSPAVARWIVALYALGVLVMLARLVRGLWFAHRLARTARPLREGPVAELLRSLAQEWSMRVVPALAVAERVVVPKVVGLLRPTILLPATAVTGLSTDELQMILTHELAHLRRHDLWVNLLQRLAETLLFFNPALWYLSRRLSTLREYCCDELTCRTLDSTAVGDPPPSGGSQPPFAAEPRTRYAAALLRVAELSRPAPGDAPPSRPPQPSDLATLAAAGRSPSELRRRIAHLFGEPIREPLRLSRGSLLVLVGGVALLLAGPVIWPTKTDSASAQATETATDESESKEPDRADREETIPITISGRAIDEEGDPIEDARIFLASERPGYRRLAETTSAADGSYRFENIALPIKKADTNAGKDVGSFEVFGIADGYALAWRPKKAVYPNMHHAEEPNWFDPSKYDAPTRFGRDDPIELDLTFGQPKTIRGRIVDDRSQPIPGTRLAIRYCDSEWQQEDYNSSRFIGSLNSLNERITVPPELKTRTTDADGRFEFTGLPADYRWRIDVRPPGHSLRSIWAVTHEGIDADAHGRRIYSGDFEVVFPRPRSVKIRVLYGDTGEAAHKVGVGGKVNEAGFWETTDEEGYVEAPVPDGRYEISAVPRYRTPYLRTEAELVVSEESVKQPTTIRLRPAAVVDITVVDADTGEPLADVDVWLEKEVPGTREPYRDVHGYRSWEVETRISHYESPRSDQTGTMRVLFEPGTHRIGVAREAFPKEYQPVYPDGKVIDCRPGKITAVTFPMKRREPPRQPANRDEANAEDFGSTNQGRQSEVQLISNDDTNAPQSALTATLPGGVTVSLIGVANNRDRSNDREWWKADGSKLAEPPYLRRGLWSNEEVAYEFAFEIEGSDDFGFTAGKGFSAGTPYADNRTPFPHLRLAVSRDIMADARQADVTIGVATGKWETVETWKGYDWDNDFSTVGGGEGVMLGWPKQQGDAVEVTFAHTYVDDQVRLVAIKDGKLTEGKPKPLGSGEGLAGLVYEFPNHQRAALGDLAFQKRPYTRVTFRNVSVKPGHETNPRVSVARDEPVGVSHPQTVPEVNEAAAILLSKIILEPNLCRHFTIEEGTTLTLFVRLIKPKQIRDIFLVSDVSVSSTEEFSDRLECLLQVTPAQYERIERAREISELWFSAFLYKPEHKHIPQQVVDWNAFLQSHPEYRPADGRDWGYGGLGPRIPPPDVEAIRRVARNRDAQAAQEGQSDDAGQTEPSQPANPVDQAAIQHLNVVIARHVMLLEGREIITWEQLEEKITAVPDPSLAHPHFYVTRGAREIGVDKLAKIQMSKLHRTFNLKGHSEGSLWPRSDVRYDRIESADDLVPNESLRVDGKVVDERGRPVAGAQVLLITPVDESIAFKSYHIALVEGRVRNPLEHVMTRSDDEGTFTLYPPAEESYYVIVLHPDGGFALTTDTVFTESHQVTLSPWAELTCTFPEEPEAQEADLRAVVPESDDRPEVVINQYWSDLKRTEPTLVFGFSHVPSGLETTIQRSFSIEEGGSIGLPGGSVGLLPGETRRVDLGPLPKQQREQLDRMREDIKKRHEAAESKDDVSEAGAGDEPRAEGQFELVVIGPDGKPVPGALVEVRTKPAPTAEHVLVGEFVRPAGYGPFVGTDAQGRMVLQLPEQQPQRFNLSIKTPGYGPYWADFSSHEHPQTIPPRFVAELEEAWSVGGVVVDERGTPIAGVEVDPSVKYKMRPGDVDDLGVGTRITTDAAGKWRFDNVPVSKSDVFVSFDHPEFMSLRQPLARDGFGLAAGDEPAAKVVLQRGLTVTGRVTDPGGEPIEGALLRTQFLNDIREARTDADGEYTLEGCEPRMVKIVVSADGRATDMKEVRIGPELEPVNFEMQPGGRVRIRVLDENGEPLPRARIFFQRWRGNRFDYFEFDHVDQYADANGVWEWNEAPLDGFQADICSPGGTRMQLGEQPIAPREEEYVFRLPPALVISGKVTDKQTGEPIKRFRVVPGVRSSETHMHWVRGNGFEATDGEYRIQHHHDYFAHLLRIEADGYAIAVSRDVKSDEGNVRIDFELQPAKDIAATLLTPDGRAAAGAKIALGVAGSQISVKNGDIDDGSTLGPRRDADEHGQFRFPAQSAAFQLVITHPSGYAYLKSAEQAIPSTIRLTPWARVEGTFRVGPEPAANVELTLGTDTMHSYGEDVPNIFTHHDVTTGADGRYMFERVVPGRGWVGRRILLMVSDGAVDVTSSKRVKAQFPAGETTALDLGGDGRAVVGRLVPPPGFKGPVLWNFALVKARIELPRLETPTPPADVRNDPDKERQWLEEWKQTPEGKAWQFQYELLENIRKASPYFSASVDRDGTFRIDDVPAGSWVLSARFSQHAAGRLAAHHILVPDVPDIRTQPPLDLGDLQLQ